MEKLIPVVNKLQDVFSTVGSSPIDLPQIVVIGSQSSGKSSVLESIVGKDFLPRGTGIVTRRPLVLQLHNTGSSSESSESAATGAEDWGEFLHKPGQRYTDFEAIREEIAAETDRLTGKNRGISDLAISLSVYSPNVLNLTLVDLPGITKVPVGDQPADIEAQIRTMCMKFIGNPNSIILAVTPANSDIANSDALQMARIVDPDGARTCGVLTKLDLMDRGTHALDALQGRVIPLRLGYVGVVNRSQRDIEERTPISACRREEQKFFATHPAYRSIAAQMGMGFLTQKLKTVLMHHIRECLPELKSRIAQCARELREELGSMGNSAATGDNAQRSRAMLAMLHGFARNFSRAIAGRRDEAKQMLTELYGGARLNYLFHESFGKTLLGIDPFDNLSQDDIRTAIRNASGSRTSLFVPEASFEILAKRQIALLEQPGLECVEMVFDELRALSATCMPVDLERFAALKERVTEVVHDILRGSLQKTQDMVSTLIKLELAHINTNHPDFIGGARAVAQLNEPPAQEAPQPPRLAAGAAAASLPTDPASLLRRTIPDGTRIVLVSCNGALVTAPPDGRGAVSATAMAPSPSTCFVVRWLLDGETSGLYRLGLQSGATGKWLSCNPASMFASSVLKVDANETGVSESFDVELIAPLSKIKVQLPTCFAQLKDAGGGAARRVPPAEWAFCLRSLHSGAPCVRVKGSQGGIVVDGEGLSSAEGIAGVFRVAHYANSLRQLAFVEMVTATSGGGVGVAAGGGASGFPSSTAGSSSGGYERTFAPRSTTHAPTSHVPSTLRSVGGPSEREILEMRIIKTLIASYFKIVQVNFADLVPKTIMQFMVLNVKNSVESELVRRLYKRDLFDELLVEDRGVAQRRKEARSMLALLEKAEEIVAEIRDFSAFT